MGRGKHRTKISIKDVAELVGMNEQTVRRHCRDGEFARDDLGSIVEYILNRTK